MIAIPQFGPFALVGLATTIVHYAVLVGLTEFARISPVYAALAGYLCGGLLSYLLSRAHVFRTQRSHAQAGWRFLAVMAGGFGLTYLFMRLLHDGLGARYLLAQIVTTGLVMIWNFVAHKFFTFGERLG